MAEHKHGSMNIEEHEKTFASFVSMVTKSAIFIIVALIVLAIVNG
ncbi:MAG: aa3-type cytochrome c oxidase subunit IV [Tranquillimonas sp.]|jgi:flagellar biogenesis protein FliO